MKATIALPSDIVERCRRLAASGRRSWVWGRSLAMGILGREVADWPLLVEGQPPEGGCFGPIDARTLPQFLRSLELSVEALAFDPLNRSLCDPCRGLADLRRRVLRPAERRPGVPVSDATLWWALELVSQEGFRLRLPERFMPNSPGLPPPAQLREALNRILLGPFAERALEEMRRLSLLTRAFPEFLDCDIPQGPLHRFTVAVHSLMAAATVKPELHLRLAALLHDVGKGPTFQPGPDRPRFPGHDREGAALAGARLAALGYNARLVSQVQHLIRQHMFGVGPTSTEEALARFVRKVGAENVIDLLELRRADIVACGGAAGTETLAALQVLARRLAGILAALPATGRGADPPE